MNNLGESKGFIFVITDDGAHCWVIGGMASGRGDSFYIVGFDACCEEKVV